MENALTNLPAALMSAASPPLLPPTIRRWSYALDERPPGHSVLQEKRTESMPLVLGAL